MGGRGKKRYGHETIWLHAVGETGGEGECRGVGAVRETVGVVVLLNGLGTCCNRGLGNEWVGVGYETTWAEVRRCHTQTGGGSCAVELVSSCSDRQQ